ncbi:MAG: TetR family transcriptional regulator [Actinomycetota bacterium]|nr:TetR family transcriptional regulator [Actinomycetota bacterium]
MRRPLSRERILQAALELMDAEGLETLTMRRVAADLGVEAMSLYHHVPNKDGILEGVFDLVIAKADLPTGAVTAAQWIQGAADSFRRLAVEHPRIFPLLTSRPIPLTDEAAAEPLEAGLAAFGRLGLSASEAYAAVQAVSVSLLAIGLLESQLLLDPDPSAASRVAEVSTERFPLLHALPDLELDPGLVWSCLVTALVRGFGTGLDGRGHTA